MRKTHKCRELSQRFSFLCPPKRRTHARAFSAAAKADAWKWLQMEAITRGADGERGARSEEPAPVIGEVVADPLFSGIRYMIDRMETKRKPTPGETDMLPAVD